ncbi:hypothetical protein [Sorangium sp. So ce1151]|uniref:hypothetical protein n=1 Tax=Sorangium sp. So ce1151 TaxID=3133332 RepID=UPI003F5ED7FE
MATRPQRRILPFLVGLATIIGLGYGFYWILSQLVQQLNNVTSDTGKAIVTAGVTVFSAVISLVVGKAWEQRVKIQEEVRQRKLPVYEAQIQLLFSAIFASREGSVDDHLVSPGSDEVPLA